MMKVNVGGKEYVICRLLGGQRPVWHLIEFNGKQMTKEQFAELSDADKAALTEHVRRFNAS